MLVPPATEHLLDALVCAEEHWCCAETLLTFVSPDRLIRGPVLPARRNQPAYSAEPSQLRRREKGMSQTQLSSKRLIRVLHQSISRVDTHNPHPAVLRAYPSGDATRPPPPPRTTACRAVSPGCKGNRAAQRRFRKIWASLRGLD